jgi:hypothetical protein
MGAVVGIGYFAMRNVWYIGQLAVLVPLGGAIYVAMIFKSKAVTKEMVALLRKQPQ